MSGWTTLFAIEEEIKGEIHLKNRSVYLLYELAIILIITGGVGIIDLLLRMFSGFETSQ